MDRKAIAIEDKWDLSTLFVNDEAFEEALQVTQSKLALLTEYVGKLKDATELKKYFDLYYQLETELENVFTYA